MKNSFIYLASFTQNIYIESMHLFRIEEDIFQYFIVLFEFKANFNNLFFKWSLINWN